MNKSIVEHSQDLESQIRGLVKTKAPYFAKVELESSGTKIYSEDSEAYKLKTKAKAPDPMVWERLRDTRDEWLATKKLAKLRPELRITDESPGSE